LAQTIALLYSRQLAQFFSLGQLKAMAMATAIKNVLCIFEIIRDKLWP
jgi:hypothetical protein